MLAGDDPATAQARPRWLVDSDRIRVEGRMSDPLVIELERRGHRVERAGDFEGGWGPVSMIRVEEGMLKAAADPRVATTLAIVDQAPSG